MGNSCQRSVPSINIEELESHGFLFTTTGSAIGYRNTQEDTVKLYQTKHTTKTIPKFLMSAIFDGHYESYCSEYLKTHFVDAICNKQILSVHKFLSTDHMKSSFLTLDKEMEEKKFNCDENVFDLEKIARKTGSCCNAVFIVPIKSKDDSKIYDVSCVNVGDSRAIIIFDDENDPIQMSNDHKTSYEGEVERIYDCGVDIFNARVGGKLAVTRAFGDFEFKKNPKFSKEKQAVICIPEIKTERIVVKPGKRVVVFHACDGVWDVLTNSCLSEFINYELDIQKNDPTRYSSKRKKRMDEFKQKFDQLNDNNEVILNGEEDYFCIQPKDDKKYDSKAILKDIIYTCIFGIVLKNSYVVSCDNVTASMTILENPKC